MRLWKSGRIGVALWALFAVFAVTAVSQNQPPTKDRESLEKLFKDGNFNDAYEGLRARVLDPNTDARQVGDDLQMAVQCLQRLGRDNERDDLLEGAVKTHSQNWRLLQAAAQIYMQGPHHGYIVAGQFQRGNHRGGGQYANAIDRDRVRALQLMRDAMPLANADDNKQDTASFYKNLADHLLGVGGNHQAWRLQVLTNLDELPDYEEGYSYYQQQGAPVDAEGNPIYHEPSPSWDAAETDGQRWRWALEQVVEYAPQRRWEVVWTRANFLHSQFGVQTMAHYGGYGYGGFGRMDFDSSDGEENESGTYALHTLAENETIARLATGIKRFELPDEHNHIKLLQQIVAESKNGFVDNSLNTLAQVFENRRQYPQAANYWRQSLEHGSRQQWIEQRLDQIVGNWGMFETVGSQPAAQGATVEFRFRNGKEAQFTAHEIKIEQLLSDVKAYLRSDPRRVDGNQINIENIGWRLVHNNEQKYVGAKAAEWTLALDPRENHFDRRITVSTPLQKPGAYLLTAKMTGGNESKIVLWVADTALVRKQLDGKSLYFVADANTGRPIPRANLEFFGYRQEHVRDNVYRVETTNFAERADAQGQVIPDPRDLSDKHQWLIVARGAGGRLAYLGFRGVWSGRYYDQEYNEVKIFAITDRPVYRPGHTAHYKFWVRHAQYDQPDVSQFAGKTFPIEIYNPKGEKIESLSLTADEFGGVVGSFEIPADAQLGQYSVQLRASANGRNYAGSGAFRIEEYKKPEFEVTIDAPTEPVMLGETITAKINARYYFGSPVTNATVNYKITRSDYSQTWYPVAEWDWCFGPGYWWFCYDYPWYPGWSRWVGCIRPFPWWWQGQRNPPEIVAEREVEIGEDGIVEVEIDTALAKELRGDQDHRYQITAEVRDQSRRTIVGQGEVLVARQPFKIFSWVDRGYYRVGDTIRAHFQAQTLDKRPVQGEGELTLLKVTYDDDRQPIETPVQSWPLDTNDEGRAELPITASAPGQYRLSYKLTDSAGHTIEGGYLFTVMGEGFDGSQYRFNALELIPDKRDYQPGETVKLQINTDRADSTVLLFVRPANGVYLPPKMIRMQGKSVVEEIGVVQKDMPNFFVEAITIADGQVHSEAKEIIVPPEKRVLNVAVEPSSQEYKPGEKATVDLHLTDHSGENFVGSTVVAIYDKSLEYISGGGNVADIKEFFWKWRRRHHPSEETSLQRYSQNLTLPNKPGMSFLGVFGATVADELNKQLGLASNNYHDTYRESRGRGMIGGGFGGAGGRGYALEALSAAPMSMAQAGEAARFDFDMADSSGPSDGAVGDKTQPGGGDLIEPTVRTNFADTALWVGALTTDANGRAQVDLTMPENLTTWKVKVWGMGHGTKVGSGEAEVVTRKNLIVRLQAPRFFVQKDEVVLSANVHNYLKSDKQAEVTLDLPGDELQLLEDPTVFVNIPAGSEQRVDWRVKVVREGNAVVRMKALTDEESDAMEMTLPCHVHGMLKTESWAGTVRPDQQNGQFVINVPTERRVEQSRLEIRYSPTLAGAMVDALPYLADYPYGCTEQTLNRFLPTVVTQKILIDMNLDLDAIRDNRTNLNAQEIGDNKQRAAQWQRFDRNPVFDREEVDRMVKEGVTRLTNMQLSDGGWGWFSGYGEHSFPHTTAVVVHGLQIAQQNDVALVPGMLERGVAWLQQYQNEQVTLLKNAATETKPWKKHADNLDAFTYMVLVDAGIANDEMRDFLYRDRIELAVYSKAMFGLALHKQNEDEKLAMIMQNIQQFLVQDEENETAYLKLPADNHWWYWYGSETEANAYYLKLLALTDAQGQLAPRLVKYLLNNRKHATYWRSTRDTAVCVEAFADYLRASGELAPDMTVEIFVDGEKRSEERITAENLFTFNNKFVLTGDEVTDGSHDIEIRRSGQGPVYYNAYLTNFTLEDHITRAGLEVRVNRKYYKLVPDDKTIKAQGDRGQAIDQKVEKYERVELHELDVVNSGELVEIELEIDSKNDYEYLIFEDMKAAGFEPVDQRSGYVSDGLHAYRELRDDRVSFFIARLARGKHSVSYRMRAEIPGRFSALPAKAYAMYAPELKGNSEEIKLRIED